MDDNFDDTKGEGASETGGNDEIGATTFFFVRHLTLKHGVRAITVHSGPRQHALELQERRRGYNGDVVADPISSGFEEERYVQNDQGRPVSGLNSEKSGLFAPHKWMKNGFEPAELGRIAEYSCGDRFAINGTVPLRTWEHRSHLRHAITSAVQQTMYGPIGIEHRNSELAEHGRGRAFPIAMEPVSPRTTIRSPKPRGQRPPNRP